MRQKPAGRPSSSERVIKDIKRNTRKQYGAEEKIRIVLDGLRGEDSIAELCRREGIARSLYYKWSKDFMEAGKPIRARSPSCDAKLEIIRLVERSHLPAKQTLDMLSVPRTTFYRWYERYRHEGQDALQDKVPLPARIWNRIPDDVRDRLITLASNPEEPDIAGTLLFTG